MPPCLEAEGNGQRELIVLDNHGVQRTCRFSAVSKHDIYANISVDKSHLAELSLADNHSRTHRASLQR